MACVSKDLRRAARRGRAGRACRARRRGGAEPVAVIGASGGALSPAPCFVAISRRAPICIVCIVSRRFARCRGAAVWRDTNDTKSAAAQYPDAMLPTSNGCPATRRTIGDTMLTSIARITRSAAVLAGLFGLYLYAAPEHAQLARTAVRAATGGVANDCERPPACRAAAAAPAGSVLDVLGYASMPKSICLLQDGIGEAAAAGDAMIARAYNGGVVQDFGDTAATAN